MEENLSRYSCDSCHSRKIRCSREISGCRSCKTASRPCAYSRSGVIQRTRRPNNGTKHRPERLLVGQNFDSVRDSPPSSTNSEPDTATTAVEERLRRLGGDCFSSGPLPLLFSDHHSFWQEPEFIDMIERMKPNSSQFFTFEQEAEGWAQGVRNVLDQGQPLMTPIPADILVRSAISPETIKEKGYLLMFYGIMLTVATSDDSFNEDTQVKLKWNLWLCLNDARLLLQPTEVNIQALILLACHVQDFHTPSLCWMVSTTAFRMLQALGTSSPTMDAETKQRRCELFWFLNALDKSLALIFGRPPVFHRAMCEETPMPSMQRLRSFQPHIKNQPQSMTASNNPNSVFGAHLLHQMHLVSKVTADIWYHLYDKQSKNSTLEEINGKLTHWHEDTTKVLEASLLTERPFLDSAGIRSLELGIQCVQFQFHYLTVLLIKSQRQLKYECLKASRNALLLLDGLISGSVDMYNGVVWHLLYCPFTPFFVLFAHVLAEPGSAFSDRALQAMEHLPLFLKEMTSRHPLAGKLFDISSALFERARSLTENAMRGPSQQGRTLNPHTGFPERSVEARASTNNLINPFLAEVNNLEFLRGFFPGFESQPSSGMANSQAIGRKANTNVTAQGRTNSSSGSISDTQPFSSPSQLSSQEEPYDFLADSMFDWFAWESYGDSQSR